LRAPKDGQAMIATAAIVDALQRRRTFQRRRSRAGSSARKRPHLRNGDRRTSRRHGRPHRPRAPVPSRKGSAGERRARMPAWWPPARRAASATPSAGRVPPLSAGVRPGKPPRRGQFARSPR
jgi:hypothetical protein